jgi:hypothetical protein
MKLADLDLLQFGHTIQMAGAIYQDANRSYVLMFPEDRNDLPLETLELTREEWEQVIKQTDLLETEVLAKASDGTLAKVVIRKSTRQIEQNVSWRVYQRDSYACRYCGITGVPLTVDHLILWEEGGPSIVSNLVAADRKCNKIRGNTPYPEWLQSDYYRKVSRKLSPEVRAANEALVATLDAIPRRLHQRSR